MDDGKGASVQSSLNLSVGANQPPQISSFSANPAVVGPGGSSILTCIANDPDGDVVRYTWSAIEGNITGTGNKVTWDEMIKANEKLIRNLDGAKD